MADDHRARDSQGFLHDSAARFADKEMTLGEQLRHPVGPTEQIESIGRKIETFQECVKMLVSSRHHG